MRLCPKVLAGCLSATLSAGAAEAPALTRQSDLRLSKLITVSSPRMLVGELVQQCSQQTGVTVQAEESDGASDAWVTVHLNRVPLVDAMEALRSVVSYRNAEWRWIRTGSPGRYAYRLVRPLQAREVARLRDEEAQAAFEAHAKSMLEAALADPVERQRMARNDDIVRQCLGDERIWSGLRTFAEAVPAPDRARLLGGGSAVTIPVQSLSDEGKTFVQKEWGLAGGRRLLNSDRKFQEPDWIRVNAKRVRNKATPSLYIEIDGIGAYSYLGGTPLDVAFKQHIGDSWLLPGDSLEDPAKERVIGMPDQGPRAAEMRAEKGRPIERQLATLAAAAPISLIARLPREQPKDPGSPVGKSLADYLLTLGQCPPDIQYKFRKGILLLAYPTCYLDRDDFALPWKIVRDLRKAEERGKGILRLGDFCDASDTLSELQLSLLGDDYPAMLEVPRWRAVLQMRTKQPDAWRALAGEAGLSLKEFLRLLSPASRVPPSWASMPEGTVLRLAQEDETEKGITVRTISLSLVSPEMRVLDRRVFSFGARTLHGAGNRD
jgi:hypothetical protein